MRVYTYNKTDVIQTNYKLLLFNFYGMFKTLRCCCTCRLVERDTNEIKRNPNKYKQFSISRHFTLFHDFSSLQSPLRVFQREKGGGLAVHGMTVRTYVRTYTYVVAKRAICGRSQIATTVNCNFLALARALPEAESCDRSWTIAFHARLCWPQTNRAFSVSRVSSRITSSRYW